MGEHPKGWLSKPVPVTRSGRSQTAMSPRFCISEQHGLQEPIYRAIGDLSRSCVNTTTDTKDTYSPQDLATLVAQVRSLARLGASDFMAWSADFANAYKTIGLREPPNDASAVCFVNPHTNAPHKACISVQPFGSSRAPANWGRVVTFIQFLAKELLPLTAGAFVDAVYCAEPTSVAASGFWDFKRLAGLLGFPTPDKKDRPPSTNLVLLGALISIDKESFCASARPGGISKICGHIAQALQKNCLTPAAASKIRGRLGFYASLLSGKLGRGTMWPLIARKYRQRGHKLTTELTRNLAWRYSALWDLPPRVTPFAIPQPVGAHTDAQGHGHIAAVYTGRANTTVSLHLPDWLLELVRVAPGESPIFIYELRAAVLMVCIALEWPRQTHQT